MSFFIPPPLSFRYKYSHSNKNIQQRKNLPQANLKILWILKEVVGS